MVTEGAAVLRQLQGVLAELQGQVDQLRAESERLDGQMRELVASRAATLVELARHYLPDINRESIERAFPEARASLLAILEEKEKRRQAILDQLAERRAAAGKTEAELNETTARLNEKVRQREELESQVAQALQGDPVFPELSRQTLQAEQALHRNEQRVESIRQEAAAKLPAFERSRLFRYLYDRGYGTPGYQAQGLIERLDRWVARLIDFPSARKGYEYLRRMPALVEAEVERRRVPFNELMERVEAIETRYADQAGLTAVLAEGQRLGAERDRLVRELDRIRAEVVQLDRTRQEWPQAERAYYQEALGTFQQFLDRAELGLLERRARQSPEPRDDQLVGTVGEMSRSIQELNRRVHEQAEARQAAERARDQWDLLVRRFREANYDSDRSYFHEAPDVRGLAEHVRGGRMETDRLWSELQRSQRFRPAPVVITAPAPGPAPGVPPVPVGLPEVVLSPAGRILIGALGQAVDAALRQAATRSVERRADTWSIPSMPMPSPPPAASPPPPAPPPASSSGGFTSGEGF